MDLKRKSLHIRDCFLALLNSLAAGTPPWNDWQIIAAFTGKEIDDHCQTPLIYVEAPVLTECKEYLGSLPVLKLRLTIGAWNGPKSGGIDEHIVMLDELCNLFGSPDVHSMEFDVELGGVEYTGHTLSLQGVRIEGMEGPQRLLSSSSAAIHSQLHLKLSL